MRLDIIAVIGVEALYLFFIWLASGLIFPVISVIVWLLWPPKADSDWKVVGPFGRQKVQAGDPAMGREPAGGAGPTGSAA